MGKIRLRKNVHIIWHENPKKDVLNLKLLYFRHMYLASQTSAHSSIDSYFIKVTKSCVLNVFVLKKNVYQPSYQLAIFSISIPTNLTWTEQSRQRAFWNAPKEWSLIVDWLTAILKAIYSTWLQPNCSSFNVWNSVYVSIGIRTKVSLS